MDYFGKNIKDAVGNRRDSLFTIRTSSRRSKQGIERSDKRNNGKNRTLVIWFNGILTLVV